MGHVSFSHCSSFRFLHNERAIARIPDNFYRVGDDCDIGVHVPLTACTAYYPDKLAKAALMLKYDNLVYFGHQAMVDVSLEQWRGKQYLSGIHSMLKRVSKPGKSSKVNPLEVFFELICPLTVMLLGWTIYAFDFVTTLETQTTESAQVIVVQLSILSILHQRVQTVLLHQAVGQLTLAQRIGGGHHQKIDVGDHLISGRCLNSSVRMFFLSN